MEDNVYACPHCRQTGGEDYGKTSDGWRVCSKCGYKRTINGKEISYHNPEWDPNPSVTYHIS